MAENKGVLPSSNVNTLGNANNKWENVYANKFTGALTGNASTASSAAQLTTARSINGTNFNGTGNITTANWGTARNISIADATATNTGTGVSVNGSGNVTLKLPATIKASLTGNVTGNVSGSSSSCTGNSATATSANYSTNAGNADKLDGYHYTDIINNAKASVSSGVMVAPNWAGAIMISCGSNSGAVTHYTMPSNGWLIYGGKSGESDTVRIIDTVKNLMAGNEEFLPLIGNLNLVPVKKGFVGMSIRGTGIDKSIACFIPCS